MNSEILLLGIPFDKNSSYLQGPAEAPDSIRKFMNYDMCNNYAENGICIDESIFTDIGNLSIPTYDDIYFNLRSLGHRQSKFMFLGGDHSISYPLIKYCRESFGNFTLLHFDAHSDLYDSYAGNKYSHACPFARIMEDKLVDRLIQVGIRTLTNHQRLQASKFGVEIIEMKDIHQLLQLKIKGPIYISLDIDVFDPAFAPGVSHYEPGGMNPRFFLDFLHQLDTEIISCDIVEFNPLRDNSLRTASLVYKIMKEMMTKFTQKKILPPILETMPML